VNVIDDAGGTFTFPRLPILVRERPANPSAAVPGSGLLPGEPMAAPR
jgi:hypothetical protein